MRHPLQNMALKVPQRFKDTGQLSTVLSHIDAGTSPAQTAAPLGRALPGPSRAARAEVHRAPPRRGRSLRDTVCTKQPVMLFQWELTEISKWPYILNSFPFCTCALHHTHALDVHRSNCRHLTASAHRHHLLCPSPKCCGRASETSVTG